GCEYKFVPSAYRLLYCFAKLLAGGAVLSGWFHRLSILLGMDEVLQGLSLHEKATVELVLDGDARVKDEINYDLCLVGEDPEEINFSFANFWVQVHDLTLGFASEGLAKSLGNTMGMLRLIGKYGDSTFHGGVCRLLVRWREVGTGANFQILGKHFSVSNVEGVLSGEGSSIVDKGESLDRDQLPKVVKSSVGLTGNGSGRGEVKRTCLHGAVSLAKGVVGTLAAFGSKEKYIMDIDESKKRTRPLDCIEGESGVRLGATGTTFALGLSSSELLIGLPMEARR
ncbi:hypothetical protein Gorai_017072, partial [Gossypium raimondii]|nr:hypothetical protein [Gossypium raimondii]